MPSPPTARIVVFARPEDPTDLRDVLQRELGLNKVDAGIAAHHAPGVLPRNWPRDVADRAAAAISVAGLKAIAIGTEAIPDLSHVRTSHHLRCGERSLEVCNLAGQTESHIPWGQLRLISVGRVPLEQQRHYVTDTLAHANPVPADQYLPGGAVHGFEAWLLCDGDPRALRCDSEHLNFEYLGARKTGSGTANFELFIADLAVAAPHAFLTPAARKYLTRGPLLDFDFKDSAALQEQTIVQHLLCSELQRSSGSASSSG